MDNHSQGLLVAGACDGTGCPQGGRQRCGDTAVEKALGFLSRLDSSGGGVTRGGCTSSETRVTW